MASEQGCAVAGVEQLGVEQPGFGITIWLEPNEHASFETSEYILVGYAGLEQAFEEYAPGPSIDIAWAPGYVPTFGVRQANPSRDRSLTPIAFDGFEHTPWVAGPTQYAGLEVLESFAFGYACAAFEDADDSYTIYPRAMPISARVSTCYAPPENVSYGAQNRGLQVRGQTLTEYQDDAMLGIPQEALVADANQLKPGLPTVSDPLASTSYPPAPSIDYRWNEYYSPDALAPFSVALPATPYALALPGQNFFGAGVPTGRPTQFIEPDGLEFFAWSHPTGHFPRLSGWFIYPPQPSIDIPFFEGWIKPYEGRSVRFTWQGFEDPYEALGTLVREGEDQTEYETPYIGAARLLVPDHHSFRFDLPRLNLPFDQTIGNPLSGSDTYTEYFDLSIAYQIQSEVSGEDLFEREEDLHITYWRQFAQPTELASSTFGDVVIGTEQFLDGQWSYQTLTGIPKVIRWLDVFPPGYTQTRYDKPATQWGTLEVFGHDSFAQQPDARIAVADKTLVVEQRNMLRIDPPHVRNEDKWTKVATGEIQTQYAQSWTQTIVNVDRTVDGLFSQQVGYPDWWEQSVRHGLTIGVPGENLLGGSYVNIENNERPVYPLGFLQSQMGANPSVVNDALGARVQDYDATLHEPIRIAKDRPLVPWHYSQLKTDLPTIGTTRTVAQYPRNGDLQTQHSTDHLVAYHERTVLVADGGDPPIGGRWAWWIDPRTIEPWSSLQFGAGAYSIDAFGIEDVPGINSFDAPVWAASVENGWRYLEPAEVSSFRWGRPGFIQQADQTVTPTSLSSLAWGPTKVENEYKPPESLTRLVQAPSPEEPATEYYDITLINCGLVVEGAEQTEFGTDWRLDTNVIGLHDGQTLSDFGFPVVTHQNQEVMLPDDSKEPAEYGNPAFAINTITLCYVDDFFNISEWFLGDRPCDVDHVPDTYEHSIEHHNRVLDLSVTPSWHGYIPQSRYGEDANLRLSGGLNRVNVDMEDQTGYGWFEVYPYSQRTFVIDAETLEVSDETDIANDSPNPQTDKDVAVALLESLEPVDLNIELQNRTFEFVGTYEFAWGDNHPLIHFELELMPDGLDATLHSTEIGFTNRGRTEHWIAHDPQEPLIDGSDQLQIWPDFFYQGMRVENEYQVFYPMGRETLLTARPKVIGE